MANEARVSVVQLAGSKEGRRVALVEGGRLQVLASYRSVYAFACAAAEFGCALREFLAADLSGIALDYDQVSSGASSWRLLPCFDHPSSPSRCLVSASGVTVGDSSWTYLGSGEALRGHGDTLASPDRSSPASEIAAAYIVGRDGLPFRVGLAPGHVASLPGSGFRECAIGPELTLDESFRSWLDAGDQHTQRIESIEAEHFARAGHRQTGDAHVHFLGRRLMHLDAASRDSDELSTRIEGLGGALRNRIVASPRRRAVGELP